MPLKVLKYKWVDVPILLTSEKAVHTLRSSSCLMKAQQGQKDSLAI